MVRIRDPLLGADRHGVPEQLTEPDLVPRSWIVIFNFIVAGHACSGRKQCHGSECSDVWKARFRREQDNWRTLISAERIRLIIPIEIMRSGVNQLKGMLRNLVKGQYTMRFFVEAAAVWIVP